MHVATAVFQDTWAGAVAARLVPQRTTRSGQRVTVYRWQDARGFTCDGMRCGHGAAYMVAAARRDRRFSEIEEG